jgi:hypothetical protein
VVVVEWWLLLRFYVISRFFWQSIYFWKWKNCLFIMLRSSGFNEPGSSKKSTTRLVYIAKTTRLDAASDVWNTHNLLLDWLAFFSPTHSRHLLVLFYLISSFRWRQFPNVQLQWALAQFL